MAAYTPYRRREGRGGEGVHARQQREGQGYSIGATGVQGQVVRRCCSEKAASRRSGYSIDLLSHTNWFGVGSAALLLDGCAPRRIKRKHLVQEETREE